MTSSATSRRRGGLLHYPGSKARFADLLLSCLPPDCHTVCSPFFGSGAFELVCARERNIRVLASDKFAPLVNFWQCAQRNGPAVADLVEQLHAQGLDKPTYRQLRAQVFHPWTAEGLKGQALPLAAAFYVVNRASFNGITGRGFSQDKANHSVFSPLVLDRLRQAPQTLSNLRFRCCDYTEAMRSCAPETLVFLDPPYLLADNYSELYGDRGDLHRDFDHLALRQLLDDPRRHRNWLLCYNNCDAIKRLYQGLPQMEVDDKELLIASQPLVERLQRPQAMPRLSRAYQQLESDEDSESDQK